jgi:transcription termination factor NusA
LQGVGEKRASDLYDEGFRSAEDVAGALVEDLIAVRGMNERRARSLIESATKYIREKAVESDETKDITEESQNGNLARQEDNEEGGEKSSEGAE